MNSIYSCVEAIQDASREFLGNTRKLEKYLDECDYEGIVSAGKKGAGISSGLYLMYRELLLSLHEYIPCLPLLNRIPDIGCETMGISVEQMDTFDFPVYKIKKLDQENKQRQRDRLSSDGRGKETDKDS